MLITLTKIDATSRRKMTLNKNILIKFLPPWGQISAF